MTPSGGQPFTGAGTLGSKVAARQRARAAVFGLFACYGAVISTWAVHLPALKQATGISTAMTGTVLLILGLGALVGMQVVGVLIDRFGSGIVAVVGIAAMSAALALPLAAHTLGQAAAGAFVFGVAAGSADIGINAAAVSVERSYGRPIMAAFHAVFSIGTVVGSVVGAAGFALHLGTVTTASLVGAACLIVAGCAFPPLRHRRKATAPDSTQGSLPQQSKSATWQHRQRVLLLGVLAFLLLLSEGCAMDWSSLHAQQHLGVSASLGALAVGSFVTAMTVSRFTADRIAQSVGPVRLLGGGALLATVGIVTVILAPVLWVALAGWALFGLGLAGGVPQVFTSAGNLGGVGSSGRTLSRVVGVGYLAILGGPAVIGWLVQLVSWTGALLVPLCAMLVCALAAPAVTPGDTKAVSREDA